MPLQTYDSKDAVPEAQRATAIETKDGKFVSYSEPEPLGDKGQKALDDERTARRAAEKLAKDEKKRADDLELQRQANEAKVPADQLEKWKQERDQAVAAEQAKTAEAERKLKRVEVERQFRDIAILPEVNMYMERMDAEMTAIVTRNLSVSDAGKLCVVDAEGKPTTDDPKAHVLAFKKTRPYLFRGPGSDGSGSQSSNGEGGGSYDPVAAGKKAAEQQKAANQGSGLAFK